MHNHNKFLLYIYEIIITSIDMDQIIKIIIKIYLELK